MGKTLELDLAKMHELMIRKGFRTYGELAKAAGISASAISRWRTGERNPSDKTISKIVDVLGGAGTHVSYTRSDHPHAKWVQYVKDCASEIIENAESIVGTEPLLSSIDITIRIRPDEAPSVVVNKNLYPHSLKNDREE